MAAKSKKRRCNQNDNKLLKLEKLQINDVICSVCQSILIEPVTLPCFHDFCRTCFNGSIENNALCCPLCRLRIGSWLRATTKQKKLVNVQLWKFLKTKFSKEIDTKLRGDDIVLPEEKPLLRLSAPGEIRSEYEAELERLKAERLQLEQKHLLKTEILVKKIQEEEAEAHEKYLDRLKQDEILAHAIQETGTQDLSDITLVPSTSKLHNVRSAALKARLKVMKIDSFLCRRNTPAPMLESPLITDDSTSSESSTKEAIKSRLQTSPEMVPDCSNFLKADKTKPTSLWNKENGSEPSTSKIATSMEKLKGVGKSSKNKQQSLPVSLPFLGILQLKKLKQNLSEETGSEDSMRQELCYFKPIDGTSPTTVKGKIAPLRVPCKRAPHAAPSPPPPAPAPAPAALAPGYTCLEALCRLRNISLAQNLPSAFAVAQHILEVIKESKLEMEPQGQSSEKKVSKSPTKKQNNQKNKQAPQIETATSTNRTTLRRTRSMGSITLDETTPKKAKIQDRKVSSERKPHLRSDTKKCDAKKLFANPARVTVANNNNEVDIDLKAISSPLGRGHVKVILEEQLRIERMIEQEKRDLELARKMDAELNKGRQPRRGAGKRPRAPARAPAPPTAAAAAASPAKKLRVQ